MALRSQKRMEQIILRLEVDNQKTRFSCGPMSMMFLIFEVRTILCACSHFSILSATEEKLIIIFFLFLFLLTPVCICAKITSNVKMNILIFYGKMSPIT